jgi:AcrR family transcriptional regulator
MTQKETQQEIERAACKLFGANGFVATSMSEIAKIVGVTKASLYYFFGDKSELFLVVLAKAMGEVLGAVKAIRKDRDPEEAVEETIHQMIEIGMSNQVFATMPDMAAIQKHQKRLQEMDEVVNELKKELSITLKNAGVKQEQVAVKVLMNAVHGYVKHCDDQTEGIDPKTYGTYLADLLLKRS